MFKEKLVPVIVLPQYILLYSGLRQKFDHWLPKEEIAKKTNSALLLNSL